VQRPEIPAVVGDEGLPGLGGAEEDLGLTHPEASELPRRVGILTLEAEKAGDTVRDVFVEREPEDGHALRNGRGVRLEQGVDRPTILLVIEQRGVDGLVRDVVVGGDPSDHLVSNGGGVRRTRHCTHMPNDRPDGNLFGEQPGTRRARAMDVWSDHPPEVNRIDVGGSLAPVAGRHCAFLLPV
jgi:hypothetical protein